MHIDQQSQLLSQQRLIQQLHEKIQSLDKENHKIDKQRQQVTQQRDTLLHFQKQDPIYMILNGLGKIQVQDSLYESHETLKRRISLYQQETLQLRSQLRELTKQSNHKDTELLQISKDLEYLKQQNNSLINEKNMLSLENQTIKQHNQELIQTIERQNSQWQKLASSIQQAKKNFFQTNQKNHQEILQCQKSLDHLKNLWLEASNFLSIKDEWKTHEENSKIQQLNDKIQLQCQIMEEMGQDLDVRNNELAQIHKNRKKSPQSTTFDTYQHSLRQMRSLAQRREKDYIALLQKYQLIAKSYEQSITQKQILENQYTTLKESYQRIKERQRQINSRQRQHEETKSKLKELKECSLRLEDICKEAIAQNEIFVRFMNDLYGSEVYRQRIEEAKQAYEKRKRQRASKNLWANTNELIEMNFKLKQKLQSRN